MTESSHNQFGETAGLEAPHCFEQLQAVPSSTVERSQLIAENQRLKRQLANRTLMEIVGTSQATKMLRERVQQAANDDQPVLIEGEPGTGTNLVACTVHTSSRRAHRPFVKLDGCVLSAESLERELFGDTPATYAEFDALPQGRIEQADGGTLLLDNVDTIALPLQKKLVPIFQQGRFEVPGAGELRRFNVRLIAASHAKLAEQVRQGRFREDFYDHLSAQSITVPTLRDRSEDISLWTEHFLNRLAVNEGKPAKRLSIDALKLLESYDWPGNLRELLNVIDRACALDFGSRLTADMIRPWLGTHAEEDQAEASGITLKEMERKLIETTFIRCCGNREKTARTLKIGLRTLSGKLRSYGYPPRGGPGSNLGTAQRRAA